MINLFLELGTVMFQAYVAPSGVSSWFSQKVPSDTGKRLVAESDAVSAYNADGDRPNGVILGKGGFPLTF